MSLDRPHEILSRRVSELDAQRLLNTDFRVKACK
jgi:hypothetical protein